MANIFPSIIWKFGICLAITICGFSLYQSRAGASKPSSVPITSSLCLKTDVSNIQGIAFTTLGDSAVSVDTAGQLLIISIDTNSVRHQVRIESNAINLVATSGNSKFAFLASFSDSNQVKVIELSSGKTVKTFSLDGEITDPTNLLASRDGKKLYLTARMKGSRYLMVFDASTGASIKNISILKASSIAAAMSFDGSNIYVVGNSIIVVDTASDSVTGEIFLGNVDGTSVGGIAVNDDATLLAVGVIGQGSHESRIDLFDLKSRKQSSSIPLGADPITSQNSRGLVFPESITFAKQGKALLVSHHYTKPGFIAYLDVEKKVVELIIDAKGYFPVGISSARNREKAYFSAGNEDGIYIGVIDLMTLRVEKKIYVPALDQSKARGSSNCSNQ